MTILARVGWGSQELGGLSAALLKTGNHCRFCGTVSHRDGSDIVLGSRGDGV